MNTYFFGGPVTRTVKALIAINIAVYLLQVVSRLFGTRFIDLHFGLVPLFVTHDLMLWQFATYMFLHGGVFHIFFNMLTLFMFGNELEDIGNPTLPDYYFITGIAQVCSGWWPCTLGDCDRPEPYMDCF
jgi:membrane associated rhomboid family serine protease